MTQMTQMTHEYVLFLTEEHHEVGGDMTWPKPSVDDDICFLAKNGTSLNVSSVKYIVAKYVKKAGIRKKVSVHTLRHTFGAHKADKRFV